MKKNSLIIILIIIIIFLLGYIILDKKDNQIKENDNVISVLEEITLDYLTIYLTNDGLAYLKPLNKEEINDLEVNKNLKERLTILEERAFYYDIYIDNYKLKGYRVKLDDDIKKIRKLIIDNNIYIVFIKENNTIGLFNYLEYYDLLDTKVLDNYNKLEKVVEVLDNKIIYLDGLKEELKLKGS